MLKLDAVKKTLVRLDRSTLADADQWERQFQQMIITSSDAFCDELDEKLWIIGQEVKPSDTISDRIDILAIDEAGNSVIIELKRGSNKLQLLQAISYAGMVSRWPPERFVETLAQNYQQSLDEARSDIEEHIGDEIETLNKTQRIILIAEDFDPALLVGSEWLQEKYGVDVRCYRMELSREADSHYLTCTCIFPPLEIAALTRGGSAGPTSEVWANWDEALDGLDNPAMAAFYRSEVKQNRENRLRYRELIYRIDGKRMLFVSCRQKYAYVWQAKRFPGDVEYWRNRLSAPQTVTEVADRSSLRFHLVTAGDFDSFSKAAQTEIPQKQFSEPADIEGPQAS